MLMTPSYLTFYTTLITGTMITVSSSSWLGVWMGLEMNLISFIPLMMQNNKFSAEAALKYFLTQAFASSLLLMCIMWVQFSNNDLLVKHTSLDLLIMLSMFMKMGAAPMHFWFPEVTNGLNWGPNMILMTWQKIAPFVVLMYIPLSITALTFTVAMCSLIGALGGFGQTSLRKILAYSSINHMSWMIMSVVASQTTWITYFSIYSIMTLSLMYFFMLNNMNFMSQLFIMSHNKPIMTLLTSFNMMSMGGLPPFVGFYPKWLVMEFMVKTGLYTLVMFMIFMTLIVLYFYMRITYSSFMMYSYSPAILLNSSPMGMNFLIVVSLMGLIAAPLIYLY